MWPWPWRYDLGLRSWHTFRLWTTNVWNNIQIQLGSEEVLPGHGCLVCMHCDLDLGDMTLGEGHDTPLGHAQQLCEISRSDKWVQSYGPDSMWTDGRTEIRTDRRKGWFLYTPQLCLRGGYNQTVFVGSIITSTFVMQILSDSLHIYIYNHYQFDT